MLEFGFICCPLKTVPMEDEDIELMMYMTSDAGNEAHRRRRYQLRMRGESDFKLANKSSSFRVIISQTVVN